MTTTSGDDRLKIGTPKEVLDGENRVAMTPDSALQLQKLGYECGIEAGAGHAAGFSDKDYKGEGVYGKKKGEERGKEEERGGKEKGGGTVVVRWADAGGWG